MCYQIGVAAAELSVRDGRLISTFFIFATAALPTETRPDLGSVMPKANLIGRPRTKLAAQPA